MKQKGIISVVILIIAIGVIIGCISGFNVGKNFTARTRLRVSFSEAFTLDDVKQITDEVFADVPYELDYSDSYESGIQIYVNEVSDEQITNLENKLKEKYESFKKLEEENTEEEHDHSLFVIDMVMPKVQVKDLVKPYVMPVAITTVITAVVCAVFGRKSGIVKSLVGSLLVMFAVNAVYVSALLIARIPVNEYAVAVGAFVYGMSVVCAGVYTKKLGNS